MKKFFLLTLIFLIAQCSYAHFDMTTPVEGSSIASDDLQFEVVEDLYKIVYPYIPPIHIPYQH